MKSKRNIALVNGLSEVKYKFNGVEWDLPKEREYNASELDGIFEQVNKVLVNCARAIVIRFDLRPFEYSDDNKELEVFYRRLKRKIKRKFGLNSSGIGYCWCRELTKNDGLHYHWMLVLDG